MEDLLLFPKAETSQASASPTKTYQASFGPSITGSAYAKTGCFFLDRPQLKQSYGLQGTVLSGHSGPSGLSNL